MRILIVEDEQTFRIADLQVDVLRRRVTRQSDRITLTGRIFALLHLLLSRVGEVLSRALTGSQRSQVASAPEAAAGANQPRARVSVSLRARR